MESTRLQGSDANAGIQVRMLGRLAVARGDVELGLPASRKVRALLAYLVLAPKPVSRSRLCELLWDVPNDPRGELRWCLSKLRGILDESGHKRVLAVEDSIGLDLSDGRVDAMTIAKAAEAGLETLGPAQLRDLLALFDGDLLDGLVIDRSPVFNNWLAAQRRRFRAWHVSMLELLLSHLPAASDEALGCLEQWLALSPFDDRPHRMLLSAWVQRGQLADCEAHLAATARLYEAEDLSFQPVLAAWRAIKAGGPMQAEVARPFAMAASQIPIQASGLVAVAQRRASLAVMPFVERRGDGVAQGGAADGLTHDIITRLAKLRSLFVIAEGSVFALARKNVGPDDAGRRLKVDYVTSGFVRQSGGRISVTVELVQTRTARIVWAETFDHQLSDALVVLDEIGNRIVASIANEIETVEKNLAILKPPSSLDAWEAYHRGLWHMYRFTKAENALAQHFFQMSVDMDPTFARAHAAISFTHWQSAFQNWGDRPRDRDQAFEAAGQGLIADDHDPAAHWAMGRALWLRGREDESLVELERAVDLSPNFALGHYALSFVQSQSGDAQAAIAAADHSRQLSPFDPLLFGMLGARAMAHVRLGQFEEAAEWALKAAARPNAHATIMAITAHCLALAGRVEEGRAMTASIRSTLPDYDVDDFLATFRFTEDAEALFRQAATRIGMV